MCLYFDFASINWLAFLIIVKFMYNCSERKISHHFKIVGIFFYWLGVVEKSASTVLP